MQGIVKCARHRCGSHGYNRMSMIAMARYTCGSHGCVVAMSVVAMDVVVILRGTVIHM